jgi:MFS family permease
MNLSRLAREFSFVKGNYLILLLSWALMNFAAAIPETYYSLYVLALGGTEVVIGLIGFISSIMLALIQFPGGYLADKHGRRWLIVAMTFGVAATYLVYGLAPSWHFILVAAVLQSFFLIYQPALLAMTADSIPSDKRGTGFSIQTILTNTTRMLGPVVAGVLFLAVGMISTVRIGYSVTFVLFLVAAILRIRLKETLKDRAGRPSIREVLISYPRSVKESILIWRSLPRSMFYLFLVSALLQSVATMCSPFFVVYATRMLAITGFEWAFLLSFIVAVRMLAALPSGKIIDRFGRRIPMAFSLLLFCPSMLLFAYGDFHRLVVSLFMFGVGESMWGIAQSSLQADLVPREHRGKTIGCIQFATYVLAGVGQLIGGIVYRYVSPRLPFLLFAVLSILLAAFTMRFIHEPEKREE